jgi:Tfp pilus assembly protein PilW
MRGYGMVEMLVSSLLSAVLILVLLQFFIYFGKVHQETDQAVNAQERLRLKTSVLYQARLNAGYVGCRRLSSGFPIHQVTGASITANNFTQTFLAKQAPAFISGKPMGEVNVFRYMSPYTANLISMPEKNQVIVSYLPKFKAGDLVMLADCECADVVYVASVSRSSAKQQQVLVLSRKVKQKYSQGQVGWLIIQAFYEAKNARGKTGFYEDVLGRGREELFEV